MSTFLVEYKFDGLSWLVEIKADSLDDARVRLRAIAQSGKLTGRLEQEIDWSQLEYLESVFQQDGRFEED